MGRTVYKPAKRCWL